MPFTVFSGVNGVRRIDRTVQFWSFRWLRYLIARARNWYSGVFRVYLIPWLISFMFWFLAVVAGFLWISPVTLEELDTPRENPIPDPTLCRLRLVTRGCACLTVRSQPEAPPFPSLGFVHDSVRFFSQTDPFIDRFHLCLFFFFFFLAMLRYQLSAAELGRDVTFVLNASSKRAGLIPRSICSSRSLILLQCFSRHFPLIFLAISTLQTVYCHKGIFVLCFIFCNKSFISVFGIGSSSLIMAANLSLSRFVICLFTFPLPCSHSSISWIQNSWSPVSTDSTSFFFSTSIESKTILKGHVHNVSRVEGFSTGASPIP